VFIDDATGRLMQLRFVASESAFSYFEALEGYLQAHGRPVAFYADKHSVFRVAKTQGKGGQAMTQFGRALAELNIEILCANSSQAKGRVEGPGRAGQSDPAGPAGEGTAARRDRGSGGRQSVPAWVHGALQRPVCHVGGKASRPAPASPSVIGSAR
jgi:hypothetical protein